LQLIETFDRNRDAYHTGGCNETQLRREFIDPFFEALGWDVTNKSGNAPAYKDVIHEDSIKVGGATKAPDYCFRIGGARKFFLETKKPAADIRTDPEPAYQLRRYAWSEKLPLSILTDFEEFAVYDCLTRPKHTDKASVARIIYLTYKDYPDRWDEIAAIFSKDAVLKGSFDKFAVAAKAKRGTGTVDIELLAEIEQWRRMFAQTIAHNNRHLSMHEINFAVQRTIDRILFLRMCEDKGIEPYQQLGLLTNGNRVYPRLCELFEKADAKYNSGLFHFKPEKDRAEQPDELTLNLVMEDSTLKLILGNLYYPKCPYEFSVLPPEILGNVYEQFLGRVITVSPARRVKIDEKPEVKKAGGVYYTPAYIVDYIVKNTVGHLLGESPITNHESLPANSKLKTKDSKISMSPKEISSLRILDPACGSGSFLLGAYTYLLNYHRDWFLANDPAKFSKQIYQGKGGQYFLAIAEKKRILLNNIFGVDIDSQAVEVTKLSLLLKVLEGESQETIGQVYKMFHERALPDLGNNIKCGNSLIGPDFFDIPDLSCHSERSEESKKYLAPSFTGGSLDELRNHINAFDWKKEFPAVFKQGGFNAVIGNPPYGAKFNQYEKQYLTNNYQTKTHDSAAYFLEQAEKLTQAYLAMIVPKSIAFYNSWKTIRELLLKKMTLTAVADVGLAFEKVIYEQIILCLSKKEKPQIANIDIAEPTRKFKDPKVFYSDGTVPQDITRITGAILFRGISADEKTVINKILNKSVRLGDICKDSYRGLYIPDQEKKLLRKGSFLFINKVPDVGRYELRKVAHIDLSSNQDWLTKAEKCLVPKIFFKVLRGKQIVVYPDLEGIYVPTEKLVVFCVNQEKFPISYYALAGILNSKIPSFVLQTILFSRTRETSRVMDLSYSQYLPIPVIDFTNSVHIKKHNGIVSLVEQILDLHKKLAVAKVPDEKEKLQRQIDFTDDQIDNLVYDLYGLTPEEIKIIKDSAN
jgi:type I restriction-modification system DNA methylase subunit